IRIPDYRQVGRVDRQDATPLRQPLRLEPMFQLLKIGARGRIIEAWPWFRRGGRRGAGRDRIQRIYEQLTEDGNPMARRIQPHAAVDESRLIGLIDDAAVVLEVARAAREELIDRLHGLDAAARRMAHAHATNQRLAWVDRFALPDADAAITTILLQHARLAFTE